MKKGEGERPEFVIYRITTVLPFRKHKFSVIIRRVLEHLSVLQNLNVFSYFSFFF